MLAGGSRRGGGGYLRGDIVDAISGTVGCWAPGAPPTPPSRQAPLRSPAVASPILARFSGAYPPWAARELVCDFARQRRPTTGMPDSPPAWPERALCS